MSEKAILIIFTLVVFLIGGVGLLLVEYAFK
jgi:hypothetical protein